MFDEVGAIWNSVAPFVGAWIEIPEAPDATSGPAVAPFVGAWIEIVIPTVDSTYEYVAPFVGAWIEIQVVGYKNLEEISRSVRRSMD